MDCGSSRNDLLRSFSVYIWMFCLRGVDAAMNGERALAGIVQALTADYGCHVVIIYGSRARGEPGGRRRCCFLSRRRLPRRAVRRHRAYSSLSRGVAAFSTRKCARGASTRADGRRPSVRPARYRSA
jgi:hypothetical protein